MLPALHEQSVRLFAPFSGASYPDSLGQFLGMEVLDRSWTIQGSLQRNMVNSQEKAGEMFLSREVIG